MKACRLMICERRQRWAIALRRHLPLRVFEYPSLRQLWQELSDSPHSAVFIEIAEVEQIQPVAAWFYAARRSFPGIAGFAALTEGTKAARWLLYELGVNAVVDSTCQLIRIAPAIMRHLDKHKSDPTKMELWADLPWPAYGELSSQTSSQT